MRGSVKKKNKTSLFDPVIKMALRSDCTPRFELNANISHPPPRLLIIFKSSVACQRNQGMAGALWPCTSLLLTSPPPQGFPPSHLNLLPPLPGSEAADYISSPWQLQPSRLCSIHHARVQSGPPRAITVTAS